MAVERALEQVRIRLLGSLVVEGLEDRDLGSRKGRTVLKLLALGGGEPVAVARLAEALWGDEQIARSAEQVGVLVSRLRGVLGAERITRSEGGYALRADWLDLDELERRTDEAGAALAGGRVAAARAASAAALALARGPLLAEDDAEWVRAPRAAADAMERRARAIAVEAASAAGDHRAAGALAEAALAADPYDEVVLRLLMRAHAAAGRPAAGLAAYARVRSQLAEDLGVSPTHETEALHDQLLRLDGPEPDEPAISTLAQVRLVGRDRELAALGDALARVGPGRVVAVAISGAPGIGKSTLVRAWTDGLAREGLTVLRGRCDELGRDLPLQPVVDALADHLAGIPRTEAAAALGPDAAMLAPLVGLDPGGQPVQGATVLFDAAEGRVQLFRSLFAAILRSGGGGRVVLVLEDLHLAGPSTLAWLAFAARQTGPLLAVTTSRHGTERGGPPMAAIELGPLDLAAAAELVGEERAVELHERSGGHPLLLMGLAHADEGRIPASVIEAVHQWIAAIGPAGPSIATAAVLGHDVDLDLLADVLGLPATTVLDHLEAASAVGLLAERGPGYTFRHELVRDAVEAQVAAPRRAFVHRAAAQLLHARPNQDPLAVAVHARLGGDVALAMRAYTAAARLAAARYDLDAAEGHLAAALALGASAEASAERARTKLARRDLDGAEADIAAAFAAGGGGGAAAASVWETAAWVAYYQRRYRDAEAFADEGVRHAVDPAGRASCAAVGGRVKHGVGDLAGASERLERALAEPAPPAVRGVAGVWLGQVRVHQGRPDAALEVIDRALVGATPLAHPFAALHGRFARALALGQLGRPVDALAACDELDRALARAGDTGARLLGPAANARAWVLRWVGRSDEADEANRAAVAVTEIVELAEAHYSALLDLADGRILAGALDDAAALVSEAAGLDAWNGTMAWCQRHRLGLLRARLALADGDATGAAALADDVRVDAAERGARRHELIAAAVLGMAGELDLEALDEVVAGLARCSGLEGWRLVGDLAASRLVDRWRAEAVARAAAHVASSGDSRDAASRLVERVLG